MSCLALMGQQCEENWANLSPELQPDLEKRFRREAEIAMALSHGSIAKTFRAEYDHAPYLVQEFIDGKNLRSLVTDVYSVGETIPVPLAAYIVIEVAKALGYLHDFQARGLVHRDVTPENIMLSFTGEVKLIDFGVAKSTLLDDSITQPHGALGKPDWAAPEALHGAPLDRRFDLYSLGLIYWYLLTGKEPESIERKPEAKNHRFLPPSTFNPEVIPELDRIVARAIDPNPDFRFQTAKAFHQAIADFILPGYRGAQELATLLTRFTSPLKSKGLELLVEEAKPLLGAVPPPIPLARIEKKGTSTPRKKNRRPLILVGIAALLLAGAVFFRMNHDLFTKQVVIEPPKIETQPPAQPPPVMPPKIVEQPVPAPPPAQAVQPPAPAPTIHKTVVKQTKIATQPETLPPQPGPDELMAAARESFEAEEFKEALKLARLAAKQGAGVKAYVLIGTCLSLAKDYAGARDALEHALRLSPDNAEAKLLMNRLRREFPNETP